VKAIKKYAFIFIVFFAAIIILLLFLLFPGKNLRLYPDKISSLQDVQFSNTEKTIEHVQLPTKIPSAKNKTFTIQKVLGSDFEIEKTLCVRSSLQTIRLLLDGKELYNQDFKNQYPVKIPIASMWNIIQIPSGSENKLLTIEFSSPYQDFSGYLNPVLYGSKDSVVTYIVHKYAPGLLIILFLFIIGICCVILPLALKNKEDHSLLYIGLFAVFISFWMLSESRMLQFMLGNQFFMGGISYISLSIFPIPMLLHIREAVTSRYQRIYTAFSVLFAINLVADISLQLFNINDFFNTVICTHILILTTMIVSIILCILESFKYRNQEATKFLISISILFAFSFIEFFNFFCGDYNDTSFYLKIGFTLYICLIGATAIKRLKKVFLQSEEARFYERLANIDILTEGKNRYAFESTMESYYVATGIQSVQLIIMDLNELKHINDKYGHKEGDCAIKTSFDCVLQTFGHLGTCYRIGGDEFACIIENHSTEEYNLALEQLYRKIEEANRSLEYKIRIAVGQATCTNMEEFNFKTLFENADNQMYQNKRLQKFEIGNLEYS